MDVFSSILNGVFLVSLLTGYSLSPRRDQHLPLIFVISIYIIFLFVTPFINAINGDTTLFHNDLDDYITIVNIHYFFAILFLILGYHSFVYNVENKNITETRVTINYHLAQKIIMSSFLFCLAMVFLWAYLSGFSVRSLFFLSNTYRNYDDFEASYNYLKLFSECFISIFFAALVFKLKRRYVILMLFLIVSIYLSFGFRFRIIILFIGAVIYYLHVNRITFKVIFRSILAMLILISLMIVQGWYKQTLREISYSGETTIDINIDDRKVVDSFVKYTRNHLAFASLIKYIDNSNGDYDYGSTMFLQPFIRFIPSALFPSGEKPYPQALLTSAKSWGSSEGLDAGEAYSNIGEMYNAFGIFGVILFSYIFGIVIQKISHINKSNPWNLVLYISLVSSLFHYISRGYLPGYIMLVGYLILICYIMKRTYNKAY